MSADTSLSVHELPRSTADCARATPEAGHPFAEFARYFLASGGALALDVGSYRLGLWLGWHYLLAALMGFCAGALVAYVASVRWVFQARAVRDAGLEFGVFVAVGVVGLVLTELLLWLAIGKIGLSPLASKLGASVVVFGFNFVSRKVLLFSARSPASAASGRAS